MNSAKIIADSRMNTLISYIGESCKKWRIGQGITQQRVADETHYCTSSISNFESGRNDSATILFWYIANGFPIDRGFIKPTSDNRIGAKELYNTIKGGVNDGAKH